jgi:hypothetical protein
MDRAPLRGISTSGVHGLSLNLLRRQASLHGPGHWGCCWLIRTGRDVGLQDLVAVLETDLAAWGGCRCRCARKGLERSRRRRRGREGCLSPGQPDEQRNLPLTDGHPETGKKFTSAETSTAAHASSRDQQLLDETGSLLPAHAGMVPGWDNWVCVDAQSPRVEAQACSVGRTRSSLTAMWLGRVKK